MAFDRVDEPIVLNELIIKKIVGNNKAKHVYFETETGEKIPFQADSIDGKLQYSLECNFKANESKEILVLSSDKESTFKAFTNVRLGRDADFDGVYDDINEEVRNPKHLPGSVPVLYQMEGISIENDKVGYRTYWDKRNGKDIWGKTTSEMVMDSVGLPNTPSYHELEDWGIDVLKVGNSLGAGALAMIKDGELVRLGDTKVASMKVLAEGPVRAILQLKYTGWEVKGDTYNLTQTITLWKGKYWYQSDVVLEGKNTKDVQLVTGITNIDLKDKKYTKIEESGKTIIYTHGNQTQKQDLMGLGLIVNTANLDKIVEAPNGGSGRSIDGNSPISHTFYTVMKKGVTNISYKFATGWERTDKVFETSQGFEKMLKAEVKKFNLPIEVK